MKFLTIFKFIFCDALIAKKYINTWAQFFACLFIGFLIVQFHAEGYLFMRIILMLYLLCLFAWSFNNLCQTQIAIFSVVFFAMMLNTFLMTLMMAVWQGVCLMRVESCMSKDIRNARGYTVPDVAKEYKSTILIGLLKVFLLIVIPYFVSAKIAENDPYVKEMARWERFTKPRHVWK